jgi:hypothetical protein
LNRRETKGKRCRVVSSFVSSFVSTQSASQSTRKQHSIIETHCQLSPARGVVTA